MEYCLCPCALGHAPNSSQMDAMFEHLAHAPSTLEQLTSIDDLLRKKHAEDIAKLDAKLVRAGCGLSYYECLASLESLACDPSFWKDS